MVRSGVSGPENVGAPRKAGAIVALLRAGKRVGVSSNSHKAINKLLSEVEARAAAGGAVAGGHALADAVSPRWIAWPPRLKPGVISCAEVQPLVPVPTPAAVDLSCMTCKKEWGSSNWHVREIRVRVIN